MVSSRYAEMNEYTTFEKKVAMQVVINAEGYVWCLVKEAIFHTHVSLTGEVHRQDWY